MTAELHVIKKHTDSEKHKKLNKTQEKQFSMKCFVQTEQSLSVNHAAKRAKIKLAGFLAEHHLAFNVTDHFVDLLKDCFPDSKILKDVQLKQTKATAVVKYVLGEAEKQDLTEKLKNSKFSILVDELTDISATKSMCILVR